MDGSRARLGCAGGKAEVDTSRIRVLHVLWTSQIGGITMGVRDLVNAIDADRYDVRVCVLADGDLDLAPLLRHPVRVDVLHLRNGFDLAGAWRFCRLLSAVAANVVHSHTPSVLAALALAICARRIPLIFQEHGAVMSARRAWRTRLSYRCVARLYDRFIAVSESVVRDMTAAALAGERIRVIENAVDARAGEAMAGRRDARAQLGLDGDGLLVGTACRLVPEKDLELFLAVARLVRASRRDVRFVVAGAGPLEKELKRKARASGLEGTVLFLGPCREVTNVWRAVDVFLFTSAQESFGRTLLESQACQTPVVAPRQVAGGAAELIAASPGILAVETRKPEDLAQGVLRVLASERLADELGRAGRDWVMRRPGVREWAGKMQSLYDEICSKPGAAP